MPPQLSARPGSPSDEHVETADDATPPELSVEPGPPTEEVMPPAEDATPPQLHAEPEAPTDEVMQPAEGATPAQLREEQGSPTDEVMQSVEEAPPPHLSAVPGSPSGGEQEEQQRQEEVVEEWPSFSGTGESRQDASAVATAPLETVSSTTIEGMPLPAPSLMPMEFPQLPDSQSNEVPVVPVGVEQSSAASEANEIHKSSTAHADRLSKGAVWNYNCLLVVIANAILLSFAMMVERKFALARSICKGPDSQAMTKLETPSKHKEAPSVDIEQVPATVDGWALDGGDDEWGNDNDWGDWATDPFNDAFTGPSESLGNRASCEHFTSAGGDWTADPFSHELFVQYPARGAKGKAD